MQNPGEILFYHRIENHFEQILDMVGIRFGSTGPELLDSLEASVPAMLDSL